MAWLDTLLQVIKGCGHGVGQVAFYSGNLTGKTGFQVHLGCCQCSFPHDSLSEVLEFFLLIVDLRAPPGFGSCPPLPATRIFMDAFTIWKLTSLQPTEYLCPYVSPPSG